MPYHIIVSEFCIGTESIVHTGGALLIRSIEVIFQSMGMTAGMYNVLRRPGSPGNRDGGDNGDICSNHCSALTSHKPHLDPVRRVHAPVTVAYPAYIRAQDETRLEDQLPLFVIPAVRGAKFA